MARIVIDGRELDAPAGSPLLQVALDNGIHIPHYCYHPLLSVDGSCRLCQVRIEGVPKLQIACNTPVRDGLVVDTRCPEVERARRGVIELLLANHPLDCPICDKAGECWLQNYAYAHGSRFSRVRDARRKARKRLEIGPRMLLDQERCILCRRCVRFCREVTRTGELAVFGLGDRSVLDIYPGRPLDNEYSICTADICPVGALESKDFHHRLRVWFLSETESVCPSCANGCNVLIGHYRGRIWRVVPRRNDAVNGTWMCDHGRLNYAFVNDPRRLRQPRLGRGVDGCEAAWEDALDGAAALLARARTAGGPEAIAAVASPHLTSEESYRFLQLCRALGTPNVDVAVPRGRGDGFLVKEEKAPNARGVRELGIRPGPGGLDLAGIVEAAAAGRLKALYLCGEEILSVLAREEVLGALERVEGLVVHALFPGPLAERAAVTFPSLTWAEKEGTFTNHAGCVQAIHAAIAPAPGQLADGEVLSGLLARLTGKPCGFDPLAVRKEMGRGAAAPGEGEGAPAEAAS